MEKQSTQLQLADTHKALARILAVEGDRHFGAIRQRQEINHGESRDGTGGVATYWRQPARRVM
eukprot:EC787081.1.p4 GENE.EC787081.1~~EC787081.1.p4  ORF type:complete len:63 (-),score=1.91 EC787081.1:247-435(-)